MQSEERPYKSHVKPACLPCRRRKSRCKLEPTTTACLMCRAHGTECSFPAEKRRKTAPRTPRRRNYEGNASASETPVPGTETALAPDIGVLRNASSRNHPFSSPTVRNMHQPARSEWGPPPGAQETPLSLEAEDDNPHIVGPAVVDDSHVLADYLSGFSGSRGIRSIQPIQPGCSSPIVFTKVQKRPVGIMLNSNPALHKLQIVEKLIEPWSSHMVDLYFQKINNCFPLLDEANFRSQYANAKDRISPALLANLYGHMVAFWRCHDELSQARRPDDRFIWNIAGETIFSELHLSPGISTITAILLNLGGRPTTSMIGNGIILGSAMALCYALGLNRNPLPWDIPLSEKQQRMKRAQSDVPLPTIELLQASNEGSPTRALEVFIALVNLTTVLDHCLEYVYNINSEGPTKNLDLELNRWIESLTGNVRKIIIRGTCLEIPGASNLRLAYLVIKLLLRRFELDRERQRPDHDPEDLANYLIAARRSAEDIVVLVQELEDWQLADFWLPIASFTFVTTVTFLIRCALETDQSSTGLAQSPSLLMARDFLNSLSQHQRRVGWDLADLCLAQHSEVVNKLLTSVPVDHAFNDANIETRQPFMPDMAFIDTMFPSIWDTLQSM
ncbi:transcriptional regulator family: Fungal Specific TF [Penicillium chermesinum]|uniref:Transcriptional regulator family: Fungal Specific TF n=1 Tax=Penicillium chermesinum TaxID=63820 RepID=A0A9W9P722_9EURO|nr:transcriptional regulator family: Fungal Specific TF [Penicillium chermesinum]KAJ5238830.1 transcriptional regulator family: Fungal Specific TF [Penicillium chermesinum]